MIEEYIKTLHNYFLLACYSALKQPFEFIPKYKSKALNTLYTQPIIDE